MRGLLIGLALGFVFASAMPVAASALEGSILHELQGIRRAIIHNCEASFFAGSSGGNFRDHGHYSTDRAWHMSRRCWQ